LDSGGAGPAPPGSRVKGVAAVTGAELPSFWSGSASETVYTLVTKTKKKAKEISNIINPVRDDCITIRSLLNSSLLPSMNSPIGI
jgi:hypothetical protein